MRRILTLLCLASAVLTFSPQLAAAGGSEFPASGTRNLGRGGSGFTRADDPTVMLRNPALLADLWEDMAYTGLHLLLPDSCFQATGSYRWGSQGPDNADFGRGPVLVSAPPGALGPNGEPLPDVRNEAFPNVCYNGPRPMLPNIGLTMKLASNLGIGLGFFPPDTAALSQFGNRDGTVDTDLGRRPSPTRWFRSHLNTSYFSALGAVGWRPVDWLRVGFGFQWALVVYSATEFTRPNQYRNVSDDVRVDVIGRDLFIPGIVASAQIVPTDNLDIALGFKWSDRVKSAAKLDVTTSNFSSASQFSFTDDAGDAAFAPGNARYLTANRVGNVDSPPIWVPQLTAGVRYADRLAPRVTNDKWEIAHRAAGRHVEDHMATERWDVEANAVVYFNAANNVSRFTSNNEQAVSQPVNPDGTLGLPVFAYVGQCVGQNGACPVREVPTYIHGKTQYSFRLGGDYNILPGVLAVRAGFSFETNGQDPQYLNPTSYMLGRTGLHAGATWRIAGKTDLSFAYAHFIQKDIALTVNPKSALPASNTADPKKYHVVTEGADGVAMFPIADASDNLEGPLFANAGTFYYHLDVVSVSLAQHF
jgi:hypothetical protein